jgi:hypothetical protein
MDERAQKVKVSLTEDRPIPDEVRGSLQTYVASLSVPKKVELAARGNREVRSILSRDPSSAVARAVVNSPRLSELDVQEYAGSPLTNEDILRAIAENREWTRNKRVKAMLVSNPRTPAAVAMRFLGHLSVNELTLISNNRNVSAALRREAKRRAVLARR